MKVNGKPLIGLAKRTVVVPRGEEELEFTVTALPLGYHEVVESLFPTPTPPMTYLRKPGSGKIERDPDSGRPILIPNEDDEDYRARHREAVKLHNAFFVYHAIKEDPNVCFDTSDETREKKPKDFYSAIYEELKAAGFTAGDINLIIKAVLEVSNLDAEMIEERARDFSPRG